MAKTKKHNKTATAGKRVSGKTKTTSVIKAANGVRAHVSRRTAEGKFTKIILKQTTVGDAAALPRCRGRNATRS